MESAVPDRIEKHIELQAPIARVWDAIARPEAFGKWFGLEFHGTEFVPGKPIAATITEPPEYAGTPFSVTVVELTPETKFAFRWHPYEPDPAEDPATQPTTLIEFTLEARGARTFLTVSESGFDAIPEKHRAAAFRSNEEGWGIQVENIRKYIDA